ncbi:primosomal protein DnaI [Periweissella fabaria]|uniref:Primosomal protein DnaI n=1 Tax=Periweissella fabaria TaxID=546157 RepID=A0ABN8BKQ9_9LACO|nr:primosomal protein DnaI [Periweissella fabaria]MCM0597809.1 primosomal protein DnaI [Periweissella fabaria]CAH0417258.1 Primosomal protein DnaI [Periweissella fabaria]
MEDLGAKMRTYLDTHKEHGALVQATLQEAFNNPEVQAFLAAQAVALPDDFFEKSAAKIFEFVKQKNNLAQGKPTIAPGYVPELRLEQGYAAVVYRPTQQAIMAEKMRKRQARIRAINMPKTIREASFDNLDLDATRQPIVGQLIAWFDAYVTQPNDYHQGMYLYGKYGIGKTYLMGALANELADHGIAVTMVHFPTFAVEMRNSIASKETNTLEQIQTIKESPILIIDDIGAESMSSWIRDDILGVILEYRMQNELATFFTSNFDLKQLEHEHLAETKQAIEPVKAARLMQRIRFLAKEVFMNGHNRRPGV